jgi:1-deoxy-D-xylulose-5-phosphate reductoisomerase
LVQFEDGSIKAQLGLPDMKLPIQYALGYPQRLPSDFPRFDFSLFPQLTFEKPDPSTFVCLNLAFEAMKKGGSAPCTLNGANEMAVSLFLQDKIKFLHIGELVQRTLEEASFIAHPTLEDYIRLDAESRELVQSFVS